MSKLTTLIAYAATHTQNKRSSISADAYLVQRLREACRASRLDLRQIVDAAMSDAIDQIEAAQATDEDLPA